MLVLIQVVSARHLLPRLNFLGREATLLIPPVASLVNPCTPAPYPRLGPGEVLGPPAIPAPRLYPDPETGVFFESDEKAALTAGMLRRRIHPPFVFSFCGLGVAINCACEY